MDLQPMTMDRAEARRAFLEYRNAVHTALDREVETYDERKRAAIANQREADEALMRGYRQLSLGRQIINLRDTIRAGGEDEQHRPKLAIARADERTIDLQRAPDGQVRFNAGWQRSDHRDDRTARNISLPAGTLSRIPADLTGRVSWVYASAIVPSIPPRLRPTDPTRYHVLWEAEWRRSAPRDPALLRALGDGLYAVLAVWDLTDLERAVLQMRVSAAMAKRACWRRSSTSWRCGRSGTRSDAVRTHRTTSPRRSGLRPRT